jgi:adenylate kinase
MVAAMNSGIRVRESIRSAAQTIDARGRSAEGRSMDRDLGTPKKSQESTSACVSFEHVWCWGMSRVGACASRFADENKRADACAVYGSICGFVQIAPQRRHVQQGVLQVSTDDTTTETPGAQRAQAMAMKAAARKAAPKKAAAKKGAPAKAAAKTAAPKKVAAKKAAPKKVTGKAAAPKQAAATKVAPKKAAPKKAVAKAAPKKAVAKAAAPTKAAAKKAAPVKAAAKAAPKKAAPKKAAVKKAAPKKAARKMKVMAASTPATEAPAVAASETKD